MVYSTGNYTQYLVIIYNGRESEKEYKCTYIYVCITESVCYTPETNINYVCAQSCQTLCDSIDCSSFHTVHGILKAAILKWFAIPSSSGPCFVITLHYDPAVLGGPTRHGS